MHKYVIYISKMFYPRHWIFFPFPTPCHLSVPIMSLLPFIYSLTGLKLNLDDLSNEKCNTVTRLIFDKFSKIYLIPNQVIFRNNKVYMQFGMVFCDGISCMLLATTSCLSSSPLTTYTKFFIVIRSDIAWRDAKYAQIWEYLRDEFELTQRFSSLDLKLKFVEVFVSHNLFIISHGVLVCSMSL